MPTIVKNIETEQRYVLLGAGFDYTDPEMLSRVLQLDIDDISVLNTGIAVCDQEGAIEWFDPEELQVVEVDGKTPAQLLGQ